MVVAKDIGRYFRATLLVGNIAFLPLSFAQASTATDAADDPNSAIFNLTLDELINTKVSIATGTEHSLKDSPAVTSVITSSDIEKLGARMLDDVLETIPGLHVSLSNVNRLDSIYSIRGIHTGFNPHVLLLLDGNPVQWTLTGGRPFMYRLPANIISRIEIIRGPGSAIYGSDAFSGVINVITKDADDIDNLEIAVRQGSFSTNDAWLHYGKKFQDWNVSASLTYMETEGDKSRIINRDYQSLLDWVYGTQASNAPGALSTGYRIIDVHLKAASPVWDFNLWRWSSSNTGNGAGGAQALDPDSKEKFQSHFISIKRYIDKPILGWSNNAHVTYFRHQVKGNLKLLPDNSKAPIGEDGNINFYSPVEVTEFTEGAVGQPGGITREMFFEWIASQYVMNAHQLRVAAGYRNQMLDSEEKKNFGPGIIDGSQSVVNGALTDISNTSYVFVPNSDRQIAHIALQDQWSISKEIALTGGVRLDDYSDFGSTTNPRLAAVWTPSRKFTGKLLYGSAFRAPSFGELLFQNNPAALGNTNLDPETIDTYEVSFLFHSTMRMQTSVNLYHYTAKNLIEYVPENFLYTAQNARDQKGDGVELEFRWRPARDLDVALNAAWQQSYDALTSAAIADAPARQANMQVNWQFKPLWLLNMNVNWVADRQRFVGDLRPPIKDYSTLDFYLSREEILPGLSVSLKAKNVLSTEAKEPSVGFISEDYPLSESHYWLQLKYHLH